jgi:3D (Asp-Asp-Asp) domain-containing protein
MWYESEAEEIAYDTVYEDDPDMYIGEEKTVTEGVPGKLIKTYKVTRYADGTEKDRVLDSEVTETEPVSKVIKKGTKAKPTPQPTVAAASVVSGNTIAGHSYSKKLTMTATAYTGGTKTATGTTPRYGEVAVDPSVIPLGSKLYIECSDGSIVYGVAYAEDTGGAIKGNIVDLYYNSRSECIQFGRRSVTVYILND